MSALRDLVTGSDACTPGDGAGPSNAAASLADALLGGRSKQQQQLHELPSTSVGPSFIPSTAPFQPPTAAQAADVALRSDLPQLPGMPPPSATHLADVDAFLRGTHNEAALFNEFENIYANKSTTLPPPHLHHPLPPPQSSHDMLQPFFQSFIHNRHMHPSTLHQGTTSILPPTMELSVHEKCRVRDRSMILARQIFADQGGVFADHKVDSLLHSLNIDPHKLPTMDSSGSSSHEEWNRIYNGVAVDHAASAAMAHASMIQQQQQNGGGGSWIDEFQSKMNLLSTQQDTTTAAANWADEFTTNTMNNNITTINEEVATTLTDSWVNEFKAQASAGSAMRQHLNTNTPSAMEQTRKLAETLSNNQDPKFQNSKFLQFVSKMSKGELIIEDNAVKEAPLSSAQSQWADEFQAQHAQRDRWANEYLQTAPPPSQDWATEFANGLLGNNTAKESPWVSEFLNTDDTSIAHWEEEYLAELEKINSTYTSSNSDSPYVMSENNPFLMDTDSFAKGKDLFKKGILSEAVLAFEAECQRNPSYSEAWRLLGTVHSENDDDVRAIAALNRALAIDPGDLDALLSLGVSHTNELEMERAVSFLRKWIAQHPKHGTIARQTPPPVDSSQAIAHVLSLFHAAAEASPHDADIHSALGVLCTMARRYDQAVDAFRAALDRRPGDYSLWNKLGATLANSGRSSEALSAYQRALELKPNYMRAWTNMGISLANLGDYIESSKYYVRALALNRNAVAVWGYLRTSLSCAAKEELLQYAEEEDIDALQQALPL